MLDQLPFDHWFSESKVRDGAGAPRVVYHGTAHDLRNGFDAARSGANFPVGIRNAFFFSSDIADACTYANTAAMQAQGLALSTGQNIVPVFLNIENPMLVRAKGWPDPWFDDRSKELLYEACVCGHDGIVVQGGRSERGASKLFTFVVFDAHQIRSALDPENPFPSTHFSASDRLENAKRAIEWFQSMKSRVNLHA